METLLIPLPSCHPLQHACQVPASSGAVGLGEVAPAGQAVDDAHGAAGALVRHGAQRAAAVRAGVRRAGHQVRAARQEAVQLRQALPAGLRPGAAQHRRRAGAAAEDQQDEARGEECAGGGGCF
uniref:Uncharacterized protein n=1 Tax=Zea mays TaxID=4577 RepID=C4J7N3_MAIZE|nr:unknown [Zea mays]